MKAVTIPNEHLKNAKQFITTKSYLIALTGTNVLVLTHKMELVKKIEGFRNAYDGFLSPDETRLLILSTKMMFWMLSLESLEILWKSKLKEPRLVFAEGVGAWSIDGTRFYLIVQNIEKMKHWIRCYQADDPSNYLDKTLWKTPRLIYSMVRISTEASYAFLSQDLMEYFQDSPERALILTVWKEGQLTEQKLSSKEIPMKMEYQANMGKLVIYTTIGAFSCNLDGSKERDILLGDESEAGQGGGLLKAENAIRQIARSGNGKYVFVASEIGFEIFDFKSGESLFFREYGWGVDNFTEIAPNVVGVCKYGGGATVFQIQD